MNLPHQSPRDEDASPRAGPSKPNSSSPVVLDVFSILRLSKASSLEEIKKFECVQSQVSETFGLSHCPALNILFLQSNHITWPGGLDSCNFLRKIDLHDNRIDSLPPKQFWTCLPHLQVLYLHQNSIASMRVLEGLTGCATLTILTLYRNPVALHPTYRTWLIHNIPSLRALDNFVIADEEYLQDEAYHFGRRLAAFNDCFKITPPLFRKGALYSDCVLLLERELAQVTRALKSFSPIRLLQRTIRGFVARNQRRKDVHRRQRAIMKIQALMRGAHVRKRVQVDLTGQLKEWNEEAVLQYELWARNNLASRAQQPEQFELSEAIVPEDTNGVSAYIMPTSAPVFAELVRIVLLAMKDGNSTKPIQFERTNSMIIRGPTTDSLHTDMITRRVHLDRIPQDLVSLHQLWVSPSRRQQKILSVVRRVKYSFRTKERAVFAAALNGELDRPANGDSGRFMLRIRLPHDSWYTRLLQLIMLYNTGKLDDKLVFRNSSSISMGVSILPSGIVSRVSAAVVIQSAWRRLKNLRDVHPPLISRLIERRAATRLQRWWGQSKLHLRLHMLHLLVNAVKYLDQPLILIHEKIFDHVHGALHQFPIRRAFPEHLIQFTFTEPEDMRVLVRPDQPPNQRLLPSWLNVPLPILETTGNVSGSDYYELLNTGTSTEKLTEAMARDIGLPLDKGRSLFRNTYQDLLVIRFSSLEQALARIILFFIRTYNPFKRKLLPLLTQYDLRRIGAAIFIQKCYRGHKLRRSRFKVNLDRILDRLENQRVPVSPRVRHGRRRPMSRPGDADQSGRPASRSPRDRWSPLQDRRKRSPPAVETVSPSDSDSDELRPHVHRAPLFHGPLTAQEIEEAKMKEATAIREGLRELLEQVAVEKELDLVEKQAAVKPLAKGSVAEQRTRLLARMHQYMEGKAAEEKAAEMELARVRKERLAEELKGTVATVKLEKLKAREEAANVKEMEKQQELNSSLKERRKLVRLKRIFDDSQARRLRELRREALTCEQRSKLHLKEAAFASAFMRQHNLVSHHLFGNELKKYKGELLSLRESTVSALRTKETIMAHTSRQLVEEEKEIKRRAVNATKNDLEVLLERNKKDWVEQMVYVKKRVAEERRRRELLTPAGAGSYPAALAARQPLSLAVVCGKTDPSFTPRRAPIYDLSAVDHRSHSARSSFNSSPDSVNSSERADQNYSKSWSAGSFRQGLGDAT